jgi:sialate O-acetylesterase
MINASWGGTSIEPWTPRIGFESVPALGKFVDEIDAASAAYRRAFAEYVDRVAQWLPAARDAATQGKNLPPLPSAPSALPTESRWPSGMYNGMIHPLVPFAMRGVIWYQGEANHGNGMIYFDKMKALIAGWRGVWDHGEFPFLYVQLARYANYHGTSLEDLWEAQLAALSIPNTGMALTIDIVNDATDAHPVNKHDVGHRLALWALAKVYGKHDLVYSGPLYKSSSVEGSKIRVRFDHVGSGLMTRDGLGVNSFQIGANGKFVPAQAKIDGDSVLVWSEEVANPTAVRFGWNKIANPNLINKEGLPAAPFRSDPSATKR